MTLEIEELLRIVSRLSQADKLRLFKKLRSEIKFHDLEIEFNINAERILDAIRRGSDLTKRGVRGVIAETVFATEIAAQADGWIASDPIGDVAFDVLMSRKTDNVRIQVKMQRKERGIPSRRAVERGGAKDWYAVEVQRTRGGSDSAGKKTRPYRFEEFDLLAVCMEPSTGTWQSFVYVPAKKLLSKISEPDEIQTMQPVPPFPAKDCAPWTSNLSEALEWVQRTTNR